MPAGLFGPVERTEGEKADPLNITERLRRSTDIRLESETDMPLAMAGVGCECTIRRIGGKEEVRKFLQGLGFVPGVKVSVISENKGNLIVKIMDSRVAVSREMASKIYV